MCCSMKTLLLLSATAFGFAGNVAAADQFLAERHAQRSVACTSCHQTMPPKKDVNSSSCEACHGNLAKVAARTDKTDINPHDSHVEVVQCLECHQGHKRPQLLCDQCHEFTQFKVP